MRFNGNEEVESSSRYEIKDRVTGHLNWKHKFFFGDVPSVGLVYEGRSGRPYSYIYVNDANGDTRTATTCSTCRTVRATCCSAP